MADEQNEREHKSGAPSERENKGGAPSEADVEAHGKLAAPGYRGADEDEKSDDDDVEAHFKAHGGS